MKTPLQITFRGMETSPAVEERIRQKTEKLETFFDKIIACHVVIECNQRHTQGNLFHIHVRLAVPGDELVVSRDIDERQSHEDIYVALRDAFEAMQRQLKEYAAKLRSE